MRENGLSYAEIARQVGGSVISSGAQKFCLRYEKRNRWKTKPNQAEKNAQELLPIEKLNGYAFKIEKFH